MRTPAGLEQGWAPCVWLNWGSRGRHGSGFVRDGQGWGRWAAGVVAVCTGKSLTLYNCNARLRRMTPPLVSSAFAGEYLIWAVAPIPFTLPWVAWQHYSLPPSAGGVLRSILYVLSLLPPSIVLSFYSICRSHRLIKQSPCRPRCGRIALLVLAFLLGS